MTCPGFFVVRYAGPQLQCLGSALTHMSQLSPRTRDTIDSEVDRMVDVQYKQAQKVLSEHNEDGGGVGIVR